MSSKFLKQSLVAASMVTLIANILSRFFGFAREAVIANYFGTSSNLDAFILAFTIPELIVTVILTALPPALIPSLKELTSYSDDRDGGKFWSGFIIVAIPFIVLSFAIYVFRGSIMRFLDPQAQGIWMMTGRRILALSSYYIFFRALESYFRSWLYLKKHFIIPAFSNIVMNIIILISVMILYRKYDIISLAYGWLYASIILFACSGYSVIKVVKPEFKIVLRSPWLRLLIHSLAIIIAVESISLAYPLVDRYLAAKWLGPGQISALRYASVLFQIPVGIFVTTINIAALPWITEYSVPSRTDNLMKIHYETIRLIIFGMGLICIGMVVYSPELVRIAFQRGVFDKTSMQLTVEPFIFYTIGIVFHSIYIFQMRFYYARPALLRLGLILTIMLIIKVVLSLVLVGPMENRGLALATSLTWVSGMIILSLDLRRNIVQSSENLQLPFYLKILTSLSLVTIFWLLSKKLWLADEGLDFLSSLIRLGTLAAIGAALYFGCAHVLGLREPRRVLTPLLAKFVKK